MSEKTKARTSRLIFLLVKTSALFPQLPQGGSSLLQDLLHFAFFALGQEAREKTGLFFFFSDTAIGGIAFAELAGDRSFAWLTGERNFCRLRLLGLQLSYFYIQNFCQRPKEKTKKIWLQYVVAIFSYLTASTKVGHETSSEGLKYKSHVICVYFWIQSSMKTYPSHIPYILFAKWANTSVISLTLWHPWQSFLCLSIVSKVSREGWRPVFLQDQ